MAARKPETAPSPATPPPAKNERRTPDMATDATGARHPFIDPTPAFYWTFHSERWSVIAGRLIPALSKLPLVDGVNMVSVSKDGAVRFAATRAKLEEEGRTLVPWAWAPDGVSYLRCLDTRPEGGKQVVEAWISVWESADVGGRETTSDEEGYAKWVESLVTSGKLPACTVNVARRLRDRARGRWEKAKADAAKLDGHGAAAIRAKALGLELDVLDQYLEGLKGEKAEPKEKTAPTVEG